LGSGGGPAPFDPSAVRRGKYRSQREKPVIFRGKRDRGKKGGGKGGDSGQKALSSKGIGGVIENDSR